MILTSIFVCLCLASAFNYFKTRKHRAVIKNLKGPFTFPLMGSMQKVVLLKPKNFFKRSQAYLKTFGTLSRCWVFDRLFIPTTDYEFVGQLLNSKEHLNTGYKLLNDWLGNGLLSLEGEAWHERHQLITTFFIKENLDAMQSIFDNNAKDLIRTLEQKASSREIFDLWPHISNTVMNILMATTLGLKRADESTFSAKYAKAVIDLIEIYRSRHLNTNATNSFSYFVTSPRMRSRQKKLIKQLKCWNLQLIADRRALKLKAKDTKDSIYAITITNDSLEHTCKHKTILEILSDSNTLEDAQIIAELNTFLYQGYLYTSTALCFTLLNIARHPTVQEKLVNEAKLETNYLNLVIKESMRLFPPQVIIGRQLSKNFNYTHSEVGAGTLLKNAEIYINLFDMQRNASKLDAPEQFKPERQLSAETERLLCYSMGPRNCPAQLFSKMLMQTIISKLLASYELLPYGNMPKLILRLALDSSNGFQMAVKSRD